MKLPLKIIAIHALATALALSSAAYSQANDDIKAQAAKNYLKADENEDGNLDAREFRTLIDLNAEDGIGRAGMVKRFGAYDTAFGRVDADADGLVTAAEISAMAEQTQR